MDRKMYTMVTIPIKPHLKKFILNLYHTEEPVRADINNEIGLQLYAFMFTEELNHKPKDEYTHRLEVAVSKKIGRKNPRLKQLILLNHYFDRVFKLHLYQYVQGQFDAGVPERQAIINFLKKYGIREEWYSYETAHRAYYRHKNDEYKNICPFVS